MRHMTPDQKLAYFQDCPMTASQPEFLADTYTGQTMQDLAASLPADARIADVGAGLSTFGIAIAELRPDIQVTMADRQYGGDGADAIQQQVPAGVDNVRFSSFDILKSWSPESWYHRFDAVYSYSLFNHLMGVQPELGRAALQWLVRCAKPTGQLLLGPTSHQVNEFDRPGVVSIAGNATNREVDRAAAALTPSPKAVLLQDAMAVTGIGVYKASRLRDGARGYVLTDDWGKTCRQPTSPRGALMAARLGLQVAAEAYYRYRKS